MRELSWHKKFKLRAVHGNLVGGSPFIIYHSTTNKRWSP
jgi:hypothetical protein